MLQQVVLEIAPDAVVEAMELRAAVRVVEGVGFGLLRRGAPGGVEPAHEVPSVEVVARIQLLGPLRVPWEARVAGQGSPARLIGCAVAPSMLPAVNSAMRRPACTTIEKCS